MTPKIPLSINISAPQASNYIPVSPYVDEDSTLANNLLCPRYADADRSSEPPSPASIESFDVLDSVAWRRGYTPYNSVEDKARVCSIWAKKKPLIVGIIILLLSLIAGCSVAGVVAARYNQGKITETCYKREGGDRCTDSAWAKCVAADGLGYCEGIMGEKKL